MTELDTLTCAETIARLADFVDRELTSAEMAVVAAHLAGCHACEEEFRFEAGVLHDLRAKVQQVRMPADLRRRLWSALEAAAGRSGT